MSFVSSAAVAVFRCSVPQRCLALCDGAPTEVEQVAVEVTTEESLALTIAALHHGQSKGDLTSCKMKRTWRSYGEMTCKSKSLAQECHLRDVLWNGELARSHLHLLRSVTPPPPPPPPPPCASPKLQHRRGRMH